MTPMGLPFSFGLMACSQLAKKASMSTCMIHLMASTISPITVGPQVNEFPDLVFFCGYYEVVKLAITLRLLPFLLQGFYFLPALPVSES